MKYTAAASSAKRAPGSQPIPERESRKAAVGQSAPPMMSMFTRDQAKNSLFRVMGSMYWPSLYTRIVPEATSSMSMTLPSGA